MESYDTPPASPPTTKSNRLGRWLLVLAFAGVVWSGLMFLGESLLKSFGSGHESEPVYGTIVSVAVTLALFVSACLFWSKTVANVTMIGLGAMALAAVGYVFGVAVCLTTH